MKKLQLLLSAAALAAGIGLGCFAQVSAAPMVPERPRVVSDATQPKLAVKTVGDHVIELPTITEYDWEKVLKIDEESFNGYGCSAVGKVMENGEMVIGRSMDFFYSDKPVYIFRTAIPGFYKTIAISYNSFSGPDFAEVSKEGISQEELLPILAFSCDVLNEKGLYIEGDMRNEEPEYTGIKLSSGTNPGAKERMSIAALIRYLGERAANVEEALALAKTVDVHGLKNEGTSWSGGLYVADSSGRHGVLELVDNKLVWMEGQAAHANFFLADACRDKAVNGCGYGRYDVLQSGIDAVKTEKDMADLIYKVRFSQLMDPDTCAFDPRSDFTEVDITPFEKAGIYTTRHALLEENREKVLSIMREQGKAELAKTPEERNASSKGWVSAYQVVVNCNQKTFHILFFENPENVHDFKL